jgi:peptidoglycan/xylan/chitin deacetylase (PgdA/CDA1 family)
MKNKFIFLGFFLVLISLLVVLFFSGKNKNKFLGLNIGSGFGRIIDKKSTPPPISTPTPMPTPTPTPKPLTFSEMNQLYGPCVYLPVLMYHHVQNAEQAKSKNQTGLTVTTETFNGQMQYLKDRGYSTVSMQDLINFFDAGAPIAKKSVLITFDDGYQDFATDAYPVLVNQGFKATVFTPTGLLNNYDYMSWETARQISSEGRVLFANHTWSHKNIKTTQDVLEKEILTADTQLTENGLGVPKVFSYPYGLSSKPAQMFLTNLNYQLAFTTVPGSILCKKLRFDLPRTRIGNIPLTSYGF